MTPLLDLWCDCKTPATEAGIACHPLPVALADLTGEQVSRCLHSSSAQWAGFSSAPLSISPLEQSLRTTQANAVLAGVHPTSHFRHIWATYPPAVASLVFPPEAVGGLLFRRIQSLEVGSSAGNLWETLIRLIGLGQTVDVIDAARVDGRSASWPVLPGLYPEHRPRDWFTRQVENLDEAAVGRRVRSSADFTALKAGLLQLHDYLDPSHVQSQSVEGTPNADYWHGIMHRREPDFDNAKYWFRRVGTHPVFVPLATRAAEIIDEFQVPTALYWKSRLLPGGRWDAIAFVDLCRKNRGYDPELDRVARCIQLEEMLLLLEHTWNAATGV